VLFLLAPTRTVQGRTKGDYSLDGMFQSARSCCKQQLRFQNQLDARPHTRL
jgi:hypothetical protein